MEKRKLIIGDVDGQDYEITSIGDEGIKPAPNSVGTKEIENESVQQEDLSRDIQDKLDVIDDSNVVSEEELSGEWEQAMQHAMDENKNVNNGNE